MTLHWNVAPRYTAGSPAMVDERTARRVAVQEQAAIKGVLAGFCGEDAREKAQCLGLGGIVWSSLEYRRKLVIRDVITSDVSERPLAK